MIPATAAPPRSRVRYVFWVGAAAVVVVVAYGALVARAGFEGAAPIRFAPDAEAVSLATFEGGTHAVRYRHGGTVTFAFPLRNTGLVPITVKAVRLQDEARSLLVVERITVGPDELPARLGPGDSAEVHVTARYANCRYYHEREVDSFEGVTVEATAIGFGVTRDVGFDHPLVVRSPMIVDCPDRTLARDDDVRR